MRAAFAEAVRWSERHGEIMKFSRSQPPATRFLAWVLLLAFASGCMGWRSQSGDTQSIIEAKQPTQIRLVRSDGSRFVLENPTIIGDSLVGMLRLGRGSGFRAAIPLHEVGPVEIEEIHKVRTALAVLYYGVAGLVLLIGELAPGPRR